MFTGLITQIGVISVLKRGKDSLFYKVRCKLENETVKIGSSIAVNGVCQTVTELTPKSFTTEAMTATLKKTTLKNLKIGDEVNLEMAMKYGASIDGHLLQGHVQKTGKILSKKKKDIAVIFEISLENPFEYGIIKEGSVGIDGISLTVSSVQQKSFSCTIIPKTYENTILHTKKVGEFCNIEGDLLIRGSLRKQKSTIVNKSQLETWGY